MKVKFQWPFSFYLTLFLYYFLILSLKNPWNCWDYPLKTLNKFIHQWINFSFRNFFKYFFDSKDDYYLFGKKMLENIIALELFVLTNIFSCHPTLVIVQNLVRPAFVPAYRPRNQIFQTRHVFFRSKSVINN